MRILPASDIGVAEAVRVLCSGGVVAHATETCYGFACDISNPAALAKLFAIKQRPLDQPVSALFASVDEAKRYVVWNQEAQALAEKYLPGPLTLILPVRSETPTLISVTAPLKTKNYKLQTLGVRISSHPLAHALVQEFDSPISTTSANLHGQPNPYSAEEIVQQFEEQKDQPDLILDSGALPLTPPSTVMDLTKTEGERVRRKGTTIV